MPDSLLALRQNKRADVGSHHCSDVQSLHRPRNCIPFRSKSCELPVQLDSRFAHA